METDTTNVRTELERLRDLPTPVRSWLVKDGIDVGDEPAVWVWALIEHEDADPDAVRQLKTIVKDAVRRATGGLWAYVLIRGADEDGATL